MEELKQKTKAFIVESEEIIDVVKQIQKDRSLAGLLTNIDKIGNFVIDTIILVELAAKEVEGLKSKEKLETAVSIIDDAIKLPWYLEFFDGPILKLIVSLGVDYMNKVEGKNWNLDKYMAKLKEGKVFIKGLL